VGGRAGRPRGRNVVEGGQGGCHPVRYIVSEFLRLFADSALHLDTVDASWRTPIEKTAGVPTKRSAGVR